MPQEPDRIVHPPSVRHDGMTASEMYPPDGFRYILREDWRCRMVDPQQHLGDALRLEDIPNRSPFCRGTHQHKIKLAWGLFKVLPKQQTGAGTRLPSSALRLVRLVFGRFQPHRSGQNRIHIPPGVFGPGLPALDRRPRGFLDKMAEEFRRWHHITWCKEVWSPLRSPVPNALHFFCFFFAALERKKNP